MKRKNKFVALLALIVCLCCFFVGCGQTAEEEEPEGNPQTELDPSDSDPSETEPAKQEKTASFVKTKNSNGYYAFSMTSGALPAGTYVEMDIVTSDDLSKTITIRMLPKYAPKTVENFLSYVSDGYYDGTAIHRIVSSGCLQGGGYTYENGYYTAKGGTKDAIEGEFADNGHTENVIAHCAGTISTARTNDVNSATSQFFLCTGTYSSWDGSYAGFGFMPYQEDIEFIQKLEKTTECDSSSYPESRQIYIKAARVVVIDD